ncbi:MAG: hypothetical protein WA125_10935 [Desulfosporosinus sp.]
MSDLIDHNAEPTIFGKIASDDYFDYKELFPSIKETGNWVYELPTDTTSYKIKTGKSGTNEFREILLM